MGEPREAVATEVRKHAVAAAQGEAAFDLLLHGGSVVTGEVRTAEVGLVDPVIANVHERGSLRGAPPAQEGIDRTARFVAPGLVDMHVHFESSMLTPGDLSRPAERRPHTAGSQCFTSALACLSGPHLTDAGLVDGTTGEVVESMLVA